METIFGELSVGDTFFDSYSGAYYVKTGVYTAEAISKDKTSNDSSFIADFDLYEIVIT